MENLPNWKSLVEKKTSLKTHDFTKNNIASLLVFLKLVHVWHHIP